MFEEAETSGLLILKERKMKEFPTNICTKFDLSDLIRADLSLNHLTELPNCLCDFEYLETLQLKFNCIQRLPTTIHLLKNLGFLDLSGNQITNLPTSLFYLKLKVLLLNGNKIETIPREIRQFENCLNELDLSYNKIKELPSDIGLLKSLKVLNLSNNKLTDLPVDIGFMNLKELNISKNNLTTIPVEFCNLSGLLVIFKVDGNPLVSPPVNVAQKGREHIFKWLKTNSSSETTGYKSYNEWAFSRCSNINATLRRPDKICSEKSTKSEMMKKSRKNRFNTLGGGSDSGYVSTGDEQRFSSYEMTMSKGSLEEINERCLDTLSTPSTDRSGYLDGCSSSSSGNGSEISGDLAKEVMLAYAETMIERKMAARGSPITSPIKNLKVNNNNLIENQPTILDISNNNVEIKIAPLAEPETSRTDVFINSEIIVVEKIEEKEESNVKDEEDSTKEIPLKVVPTKTIPKMNGNIPVKKTLATGKPVQGSTTKPVNKVVTGLKKPSLSTSKIAPAPVSSSISRKSDPTNKTMTKTTNGTLTKSSLSTSTIETRSTLKKPTTMSKSVNLNVKKTLPVSTTMPTTANGTLSANGTTIIDTMKKIIETKLPGIKLSSDEEKLSQELSSGIILCNFANKIKPRSIPVVSTTVNGEVNLSPIRSKKNAESFVLACKRLKVPDNSLCSASDITERTNLNLIAKSVLALNKLGSTNSSTSTVSSVAVRV